MSFRNRMATVAVAFLLAGGISTTAPGGGVSQEDHGSQEETQVGPTPAPGAGTEDPAKLKELQSAIRKALKSVENVHYVPYSGAAAQAKVKEREAAWREDMAGDNPCITGYSRARPLVKAFVGELPKEHLVHLLDRSLAIAESEERHAELMGEGEHARVRGFNYNPLLIREAVYNLSPDLEQKQRALDSWIRAEHERVEQTMIGRIEQMERIKAIPPEKRSQQDELTLQALQAVMDEPVRSIPVWE